VAERERREFVVVGAGPAGLAAALTAAQVGVETCVVDLNSRMGGRTPGDPVSRRLVREVVASRIEVRLNTSAWGIWARTLALYPVGGRGERISAEHVLIATGARPRPVVFPGWQLPGVTPGSEHTSRVVVAGSGPGLARRAIELHRGGVDVRAVFEATATPWDRESATYLRHAGVPLRNKHLLVRVEGDSRVERAIVARVDVDWRVQTGTETTVEADSIVLDYGEVSVSELSRLSGCTHARNAIGDLVPLYDEWMRTDQPGLLVAGDVGGVVGPAVAAEQGRLAALGVARELGHLTLGDAERLAKPVRTRLRRLLLDRERQLAAYRPGHGLLQLVTPDTVVCHCEGVTAAEIRATVIGASPDPAPVRAETRGGMGICQARDCARQIEALVAESAQVPLDQVPPLSVRPPVVPIPLGAIAERPVEVVGVRS
jgi:thioredoxin reductase